MTNKNIIHTDTAINYIERNLANRLDIETIAAAVHYSKYHLHRVFTETAGLTIHGYVQRRRLTEAARKLVFSEKPIIELALTAGYESQQAFTDSFRQLYKKSPGKYRQAGIFYPLQLRHVLNRFPSKTATETGLQSKIAFAAETDIPAWIDLLRLVVDGFPYLDETAYREQLAFCIRKKQTLLLKDTNILICAMIFGGKTGNIDFFGIHPQYSKKAIAKAFIQKLRREILPDIPLNTTTFRQGDKADPGYRALFTALGFTEAELLTEFGYPTQKFILNKAHIPEACHE